MRAVLSHETTVPAEARLRELDVETFLRTLVEARYDGWLVLEQDVMLDAPPPPGAGPVENA